MSPFLPVLTERPELLFYFIIVFFLIPNVETLLLTS